MTRKAKTKVVSRDFAFDDVVEIDRYLARMEDDGWTYIDNFPTEKPQVVRVKHKKT